jgi:cell shape-determining protein MreC
MSRREREQVMGVRQVTTFVCAVAIIGDVAVAIPTHVEHAYEAPAPAQDADGAEIIETTGEAVS